MDVMYGAKPKREDDKNGSTTEFARVTSGARSRGAIFLVNRKTRDVLWSIYEQPKGTAPADLNRAADRIADKLAKAIRGSRRAQPVRAMRALRCQGFHHGLQRRAAHVRFRTVAIHQALGHCPHVALRHDFLARPAGHGGGFRDAAINRPRAGRTSGESASAQIAPS